MPINEKEKKLLQYFFNDYSEVLSNRGCNDIPEELWKDWTVEERREIVRQFYVFNKSPQDFNENHLHMSDAIFDLLVHKLFAENELPPSPVVEQVEAAINEFVAKNNKVPTHVLIDKDAWTECVCNFLSELGMSGQDNAKTAKELFNLHEPIEMALCGLRVVRSYDDFGSAIKVF